MFYKVSFLSNTILLQKYVMYTTALSNVNYTNIYE